MFIRQNGIDESKNALFNISGKFKKADQEETLQKNENKKSIYAGELNLAQQELITNKKVKANREAMKLILDQFASDQKIDDGLNGMEQHIKTLDEESVVIKGELNKIKELKTQLKEEYGIEDDSEEQKNLELMEKYRDSLKAGSGITLTEEEKLQLDNMGELTEYQKSAMEYNDMMDVWQGRLDTAQSGITALRKGITDTKLEMLKTHPMVDAQKNAKEILEDASKQVIGMLIEQGKERVDKELEEVKEEKEKNEEDKEKTKNSHQEKETVGTIENQDELLYEMKRLIKNKELLEEDLKGIALDENI